MNEAQGVGMVEAQCATDSQGNVLAPRRYFILVCHPQREASYRAAISTMSHDIELIHSLEEMLRHCVQEPPLGVLLDMIVVTQAGSRGLGPLFELRMSWPVMRCNVLPNGEINALCMKPPRFGSLREMLDNTAVADAFLCEAGHGLHSQRRHLRLELSCRVKYRLGQSECWQEGNTLNIGSGGLFLVSYETVAAGTPVELLLQDLGNTTHALHGHVVWTRRWDDGTNLPGFAVEFPPQSTSADFKKALAASIKLTDLL